MIIHNNVESGSLPETVRILADKVLITSNVRQEQRGGIDRENIPVYVYDITEYSKDEYIDIIRKKNEELETELLDTQSALCDVYEMIGG